MALALVSAITVAACAVQQYGSGLGLLQGAGTRHAQAALDAAAILRGMTQARDASERVARDTRQTEPDAGAPAVTR